MAVIPSAKALEEAARAAEAGGMPPVEAWQPTRSGEIDMRIARDGTWYHEGDPINRPRLVRLFSTILRRDGDDYYLVTPAEKLRIEVEDAPFLAVDMDVADDALTFHTNVGDRVTADAEHPVRVEHDAQGEPSPYVMVRSGLEALIDRKSFYRMVDIAETRSVDGRDHVGVSSRGTFFPLAPANSAEQ